MNIFMCLSMTTCHCDLVDSIPGTGRYIKAWRTIYNGSPLSLGTFTSGRLKNLREVDNLSSLRVCLSVRGKSVTKELQLY